MREDPFAGPLPGAGCAPAGRISSVRRCAATGSGSAWKGPGAKVARGLGRALYSAPPLPPRRFPTGAAELVLLCALPPQSREGRGPLAPGAAVDRGGLSSVRPNRVAPPRAGTGPRTPGVKGSAATSATHPTRLETRTKESNARASQRVPFETPRRNESEGRRLAGRGGIPGPRGLPGRTTGPSRPPRRGGGA